MSIASQITDYFVEQINEIDKQYNNIASINRRSGTHSDIDHAFICIQYEHYWVITIWVDDNRIGITDRCGGDYFWAQLSDPNSIQKILEAYVEQLKWMLLSQSLTE